MTLALRFAARSDVGLLRDGNEDSVYAGPRVLAVADGMGGHAAGEVASAVAVAALAPLDEDTPDSDLLAALRTAALEANDHLRDMVEGDGALEGMGTTLTAVLFAGTRLGLLHVGDSRCYLLRDGELTQITHDHTLVQTLVDDGRISEDEASTHPQRSLITRALDGRAGVEPDLSVREVRAGDRYLLCTDGLTGPVGRRETLLEALQLPDVQQSCDRLVQLALRGGGPDNVTVIVADVVEGSGPTAPVVAGAAATSPQPPPPGVADSAAGRARAASRRDAPPPPPADGPVAESDPRPSSRRRTALVTLLALALLAVGAGTGWAYVRSQYFVGVDGEQVAVFRGVAGSVGGVRLSSLDERTDLATADLDTLARERVERGIVAADREEARMIVQRLAEQAAPACRPTPAPTPSGSAAPVASTAATTAPAPARPTPAPSATAPAVPAPRAGAPCPAGTA